MLHCIRMLVNGEGSPMAITSHDVARRAGVSQPTVSRAMRDQLGVSAATRQRVRDAARALGYVPHSAGRALSTRSSGRVAIVSAELANPFYPALVGPLHSALAGHGYRTILVTDRGDEPVELEPLIDGSLDGVVLTTCERRSTLPDQLARRGLPFVLVNRTVDAVPADACVAGNGAGARLVADLLLELGHRRIAVVAGPAATSTGAQRLRSFRDRLGDAGAGLKPQLVRRSDFSVSAGAAAMRELLAMRRRPTAVFCGNDVIALGVCNAARAAGVDVPGELTVIGFDDIAAAAWPLVGLTTVRVDLAVMARRAADLLVARMADPTRATERVVLAPELVLRATHAHR